MPEMEMSCNISPPVAATDAVSSPIVTFFRGAGVNILLVIISGILASLLFPPHECWPLAWVALIPLLIALRRTQAIRAAAWLMLLFGIVFVSCTFTWLTAIFSLGIIGISVLIVLPWLLFALAYRSAGGDTPGWRAVLLAPIFFLAAEWLRCEGWYFQFSWGQLGLVLVPGRHGCALYPYIGVYGVTFLIILVNALLVEIFLARLTPRQQLYHIVPIVLGAMMLSFALNLPTKRHTAVYQEAAAIAGIVQDEAGDETSLSRMTQQLAPLHPSLVLWPEYAIVDYPLAQLKLLTKLQSVARANHCTLVLGCKDHAPNNAPVDWLRRRAMMSTDGALFCNIALVIAPDGQVLGTYAKTHPIQFFADGVPGRSFPSFNTPAGHLGISICYDFDFASTAVNLVRHGAQLLLTPTFDAANWGDLQHRQHARMAQARAAETARSVVRATSSGVSQIIDPDGYEQVRIPSEQVTSAAGVVFPSQTITPYVAWGSYLPYLCLAISLLWLLVGC